MGSRKHSVGCGVDHYRRGLRTARIKIGPERSRPPESPGQNSLPLSRPRHYASPEEAADRRTRPRVTAFSRPPRLTSGGGNRPAAPPLTLLLPGVNTANQHPPPAPAGLWTRHGNFLLFGEYTVQCSMSVSAAAQRNSHFVTELAVHQDARASESCSLRQLPSCPLIHHQSTNGNVGKGIFWYSGLRFIFQPS